MSTQTDQPVLYRVDGAVAIITLNRHKYYNAITMELIDGVVDAFKSAEKDHNVRAILLNANGKGFCAGADVKGFDANTDGTDTRNYLDEHYSRMIRLMTNIRKPIIGAIHGLAAGAGCGIALACDLRVMADNGGLLYAFVNIGLGPDNGSSWLLTRQVGYAKAFEIIAEGERVPAAECLRLGLVNRVVPAEALADNALAWAHKMATRPTRAVGSAKQTIMYGMNHGLLDSMAYEAVEQQHLIGKHDNLEGLMAFAEKRKPNFKGK